MGAGGNSGTFLWADVIVPEGKRLPRGVEVQMLELEWSDLNKGMDGNQPSHISVV